jgi:D-3-phosphoglycerate dehydrogenase / 2-oxoglutarate reductase
MESHMKVVITDYIEKDLDWEAAECKKAGVEFAAYQLKFKSDDEVFAKIKDADFIVVNMVKFTPSLIARLDKCKVLIRHGIGYDNVDVPACTKKGIVFGYMPDYCVEDVAEHAISLIFACARKTILSRRTLERSSTKGQWDFSDLFPIYRMAGKTLGILGVGRIGSRVYHKLSNFGFRFLGCDPYLTDARRKELAGIQWVDRYELFKNSDFITVHTPVTDETSHIVNARTLGAMKKTAYLVNTSRGAMVDAAALAEAVKSGAIAGAAVDVYDVEPPPADHPLFGLENVILTPHIGWASEESGQDIRKKIIDDIMAVAKGGRPKSIVNKEVLK